MDIFSQRSWLRFSAASVTALACCLPFPLKAGGPKDLPAKYDKSPFALMSLSVGAPNDGRQVRAKKLRDTAHLKIKANSRRRAYGHPALVLMLRRSASDIAKAVPNSVMLVGDLSAASGGPISKHRSHQSGRDADVGFYVRDGAGRQVQVNSLVKIDSQGRVLGRPGLFFDDERNWFLVRSWMRDTRAGILHVFVASHVRARLLAFARAHRAHRDQVLAAAAFLHQPSNSSLHDDHFHVRIDCPQAQRDICVKEAVSD